MKRKDNEIKYKIIVIAGCIIVVLLVTLSVYLAGKLFADKVSEQKLISPRGGVECVVVSRMFNVSVDCWKMTDNENNDVDK